MANLWPVTDGDIDLFTGTLLDKWAPQSEGTTSGEEESASTTTTEEGSSSLRAVGDQDGADEEEQQEEEEETNEGGDQATTAMPAAATNPSLSDAVMEARSSVRLRYLNGAAPVIYGLPI